MFFLKKLLTLLSSRLNYVKKDKIPWGHCVFSGDQVQAVPNFSRHKLLLQVGKPAMKYVNAIHLSKFSLSTSCVVGYSSKDPDLLFAARLQACKEKFMICKRKQNMLASSTGLNKNRSWLMTNTFFK